MKTSIYTLFLFLFFVVLPARAAETNNFGIKAGVNFADQSVKLNGDGLNTSSYTGFHAGIFYKIELPFVLGVQAEVLYSQKGSLYKTGSAEIKNHFDYLEIPLYLRWTLDIPLVKPYIGAGPYASFPLNIKMRGTDGFSLENADFKHPDFGIGAMLGAEIFDRLQVSLNYQWGLRNIYDGASDMKAKNKNLSISVGLLIF